jgi:hypothetical protein
MTGNIAARISRIARPVLVIRRQRRAGEGKRRVRREEQTDLQGKRGIFRGERVVFKGNRSKVAGEPFFL